MKPLLCSILFLGLSLNLLQAQSPAYDQYFTSQRLRIDLVFAGDANQQSVYLKSLHKDTLWGGSRTTLVDPFGYGEYYCKAFSKAGNLIFSTGFSSLFQEWRTTDQAQTNRMAYNTSVWMPFPKEPIEFEISERVPKTGTYKPMLRFTIDPADALISRLAPTCKAEKFLDNGAVENKVDLVFIAEGYTAEEMDKFHKDAARFTDYLFYFEPFRSRKDDFNIWVLPTESKDSGPDIPQNDIWRNTVIGAAFNTFYIDRYMTAPDYQLLAEAVTDVPFDALYVIVNTEKYGGGGIYHYYGMSMADHPTVREVFVHEFGHSFAGLADEYFSSQVAYNDMYPLDVEPWEPNITTKVDFASKWEDMMGKDGVGLWEGGGYVTKGVFRPIDNCRMRTNSAPEFCPVCRRAINLMIDFYVK